MAMPGTIEKTNTKRGPGRPPGAKNIPKALTVQMSQAMALEGVRLRSSIDTETHWKRLSELAQEVGELNASKNYLSPADSKSIQTELEILKRLLKLTLPDVAMIRTEAAKGEEDVMQGIVVLPALEARPLTHDQRTNKVRIDSTKTSIPAPSGNGGNVDE